MAQYFTGYPVISAEGRFATSLFMVTPSGTSFRQYPYPRDMKHRKPHLPFDQPCQNHKLADWIYQQKGLSDIRYWRRSIKAPHMSTYDLWMKECLGAFAQSGRGPAKASISGGFTINKLVLGGDWVAPTPDHAFTGRNGASFLIPLVT